MSGGIQQLGQWHLGDIRYGDEFTPTQFAHAVTLPITYVIGSLTASTPTNGLGTWLYGTPRYGDGLAISLYPRINAMGVTYTIVASKYGAPLAITYTIQRAHTAPLLIYYLITPPSQFSINGDSSIINPDQMTYVPIPITARTLLAGYIAQGLKGVTWLYSVLAWSEFNRILAHYNPASPIVTIGYPDDNGTWVMRQAAMHPPVYGQMQTMFVYNASFSFSILPG
jgi:hypothetical protein